MRSATTMTPTSFSSYITNNIRIIDYFRALWTIYSFGVYDHKEDIPVNAIIFTGSSTSYSDDEFTQWLVDELSADGNNTVIAVVMNPELYENYTKFDQLIVVNWSSSSTLYSHIRNSMKCGTSDPIYRPCQSWVSFAPDYSNVLSNDSASNMFSFVKQAMDDFNHPERIQLVDINRGWINEDDNWNNIKSLSWLKNDVSFDGNSNLGFSLNTTLNTLYDSYVSTTIEKPVNDSITAIIFVTDTSSPDNYEGGEDVAQKLKNLGYKLFFVLMGPRVSEFKLLKYTTNFIYWRNMSNPQPENWDEIKLQAYGCDLD